MGPPHSTQALSEAALSVLPFPKSLMTLSETLISLSMAAGQVQVHSLPPVLCSTMHSSHPQSVGRAVSQHKHRSGRTEPNSLSCLKEKFGDKFWCKVEFGDLSTDLTKPNAKLGVITQGSKVAPTAHAQAPHLALGCREATSEG